VKESLKEASDFLNRNVLEMDSFDALQFTVSVQIVLLIAGVAVARALLEKGIKPLVVAGMSAGAFSAAVSSGTLKFTDGICLVRKRAEMMSRLYPEGYGVSAVVGLTENQVGHIVDEVSAKDDSLFVANINAPRQIVISSSDAAMARALEIARHRGAHKAVRLDVSVPSHCPLLATVADALRAASATMFRGEPQFIYIANGTSRALRNATAIAEDVTGNVARTVRWHDGTTVLTELGCRSFLEMPPGYALADLAREAFPDVKSISISQTSLDYAVRNSCVAVDRSMPRTEPVCCSWRVFREPGFALDRIDQLTFFLTGRDRAGRLIRRLLCMSRLNFVLLLDLFTGDGHGRTPDQILARVVITHRG
jgi:malonate decarboxylase epsilon subunit